jgi:hypothetical protein
MYSFAERADTRVVDEPIYGHFLRVSGAEHPGRDVVMAAMNCDGNDVMRSLLANPPAGREVLFLKQMAHHLIDLDLAFMQKTLNIFLVRDPQQMLPSLTIQLPHAGLADTGLKTQCELFDDLVSAGQNPAVIDSRELLLDPAGILRQVCHHLDIDYTDKMLAWQAGPRQEDGVWAPFWYHAVHQSTGFSAYSHKDDFPEYLTPLLAECAPWYDKLFAHAFRANTAKQSGDRL